MKQKKTDSQKIDVLNRLVAHYGVQYWWEDENRITDWVSMILIQQTTEKNAKKALENLEGYLSVEQLAEMPIEELQELIRPAGFFTQKSLYIKELINWYIKNGADIAKFADYSTEALRKELLSIKGVGQETADAMLLYIFERNVFICDQYAIRLFTRLGFGEYKNYSDMRKDFAHLADKIPHALCKEWHAAIDVHGKHYRSDKQMDESWLLGEE
ncbi:DNA repair protein [Enterococcus sp. JM4C]|uniref:endonuclease III domain-containing protein n=1 Tax=Candidatus Enterococcus huntleyi TaxID=1857217 RepID=UPI00137A39E7|nr:endonuclease III domain-containing protein [Enterococcus sp. JM4C]KAF1298112.1 DNA repair protein [Enterococcus sp. JM4C]